MVLLPIADCGRGEDLRSCGNRLGGGRTSTGASCARLPLPNENYCFVSLLASLLGVDYIMIIIQ